MSQAVALQGEGVTMRRKCSVGACDRQREQWSQMCSGHRKRLDRGKPVGEHLRVYVSPEDRLSHLLDLAVRYANASAEDDEEYERYRQMLVDAAFALARSRPK